ncbi:MAG: hypothetical protein GY786_01625 [Proteobacteria bacterium]|nr:hypothetical protein [Pseudomonadota bacterium]
MKHHEIESSGLEFKQEIPRNDQIIKTAIGFCNLYGGKIIIGVDDERNIIGLDEEIIDQTLESLNQSIHKASTPPIFPKIYSQRMHGKILLVVEISEGVNKPYFRTSEGVEQGTYLRMGRSTIKASLELVRELEWQGKGNTYDERAVYRADRSVLDERLILDFLQNRKLGFKGSVTDKILTSYKLLIQEQSRFFPSIGALLLFGKNPQDHIPESFIICTHFSGISGRKAISAVDCAGPLFQQVDEALQFIYSRLYKSFTINGLRRQEILEVPEVAIREVLINAVVHRNYSINGPIKIAIYEDRLEFFSPGIFPGPLSVHNLEEGITYIRNSVITKVFREAGIIEKIGSGFISLFSSYRDRDLEPPTVIEGLNYIKCILPRKRVQSPKYAPLKQANTIEEGATQFSSHTDASTSYTAILSLFDDTDEVTMAMVLDRTGLARATAGRRLKKLVLDQKIIKIGIGRYCYYRLSTNR